LGGNDIHFNQLPVVSRCVLLVTCVVLLAACSEQHKETFIPTSSTVDQYKRYCSVCHTDERTGAPLAGDRPAWQERIDKGLDVMIESTANGMGAMPPLGLCFECTRDDFEALINYMCYGDFTE